MIARILLLASALLLANTLHAAEKVQSFQVRGVVRELRPDKKEMVIKHETIPGYMEAMVMPFTVRESKSFKHVKPGDRVTFRLNVTDAADWIESITVEGHDKARPNTDGEHRNGIKEGDAFPFRDYDLIDSMGKAFKLEKLKGSPVAVTFFFTRCPIPTMCPLLASKLARVQALMAADAPASWKWAMVSVSIDSAHDTPEALEKYAKQQKANPLHWKFVTGPLKDIMGLAQGCGVNFWDEGGLINHSLRTVVIGADGRVKKVFSDNAWAEKEMARILLGQD